MRMARGKPRTFDHVKRGVRLDLGDIFFRSKMEANYARYLNLIKSQGSIVNWEYEPRTFWFERIKRGVRSYTPDFLITLPDNSTYFVEVKGYMDAKSKTKLKRMGIYYPDIQIKVVGSNAYQEIKRTFSKMIATWE